MKQLKSYFQNQVLRHVLFWAGILIYFVSTASMSVYSNYVQVLEFNLMVVFTQIITAYTCLYFLIPKYLNQKKFVWFSVYLILLLYSMFVIYSAFKLVYYDPKYYEVFSEAGKIYAQERLVERISNISVFLSKSIKILTPAVLMVAASFYKNQQQLLELKEQKKSAELAALKNQLNPHFLFNTLNNLYSLAIEKSEKTPEVIERLSEILDYILFRCKDAYVSLDKEVGLIENYLALEKVRYGKRVIVEFHADVDESISIAPLLLLTFIENAFKHGVRQELKVATIRINLKTVDGSIIFDISNTKPVAQLSPYDKHTESLGLENVKKQLSILYPDRHQLKIANDKEHYSVSLTLKEIANV
ncbi:MAG: histidine kinase [Bacteroidota bacterium]